MTGFITKMKEWLTKEPQTEKTETQELSQAIHELRELNLRSKSVLDSVRQPDILRSLVISMNAGKNQ
jgi:hypothetical protein